MTSQIDYEKYPAKPTTYKGLRYRSRLEAKWAAFFDLSGLKAVYEPFDLPGWSPDFFLELKGFDFLVEVKPVNEYNFDTRCKMGMAMIGPDVPDTLYPLLLGLDPSYCWLVGRSPTRHQWEKPWEHLWAEAHNLTRFHKEAHEVKAVKEDPWERIGDTDENAVSMLRKSENVKWVFCQRPLKKYGDRIEVSPAAQMDSEALAAAIAEARQRTKAISK